MLNQMFSCSGMCSALFHARSVNVRISGTVSIPCSPEDSIIFLNTCSVCSGILEPSVCSVPVFMDFGYIKGLPRFCPEGVKVGEQFEQNRENHSLSITYQRFQPVPVNRTKPEQNQNDVRNTAEQPDEQVRNKEIMAFSVVRLTVLSCSGLFGLRPNTKISELAMSTD